MKKHLFLAGLLACTTLLSAQVYRDPKAPIEDRVEDALKRMTTEEKIAVIHAQSKFSSPGVARLGIPGIWCTDGPHGVRAEVLWDEWDQAGWTNDSCTAFPALTCLAATWNPDLALLYGQSIGEEALYRGKSVLLAPGVNIYRTPLNGRNFEYMGEDPYLSGRMAVPYIHGVQENGVAACVKHYALNDQEDGRHVVDVKVSDRALYEIYLPAFKAAVTEGKTWSIMGSYNRYQGQWACHNERLLMTILRGEWGFDGAVISDWGGCCNTMEAIQNGLDLEYGSWTNGLTEGRSNAYDNYYLAAPYLDLIKAGKVGTQELDNKVRNVLRLIFRTSMNPYKGYGQFVSEEHSAAARKIAGEGMVLLQNNGVLPINLTEISRRHSDRGNGISTLEMYYPKVLVVGENAVKSMVVGGGSSSLKVKYEVTPLQGIRERAGRDAEVNWVRGYVGEAVTKQDGMEVGAELADDRSASELIAEAVRAAKEADIVIFVGGLNKSQHQDCEGVDRLQYELPYGQEELIKALAEANPNLVVTLVSGNAVAMPWKGQAAAILQAWFSGSEAGHALADVLFGDVNPSGKLPFSIFPTLQDYPAHQFGAIGYPGVPDTGDVNKTEDRNSAQQHHLTRTEYKEGIYVGYRYSDLDPKARKKLWGVANKMQPVFPFGHGLSYTTFEYGKATIAAGAGDTWTVTVPVTNTGKVAGKEVVQLYISDKKASVARPVKELKGFGKVALNPGETKMVTITFGKDALSFFDEVKHEWVAEPGDFEAIVAASATDIRARLPFTLK